MSIKKIVKKIVGFIIYSILTLIGAYAITFDLEANGCLPINAFLIIPIVAVYVTIAIFAANLLSEPNNDNDK